ncbi:MAG: hypothetical protein ONB23_07105 [candidate division KSB1 bacterium]|nr:hypothetical protein [candidate division KSB1 bacterium]
MWRHLFSLVGLIPGWFVAVSVAQVELNGAVSVDYRVRTHGAHRLTWNENRLDIKLKSQLSPKASAYGELWVRNFGFPRATSLENLQVRDRSFVQPWAVELREGYLSLYGFPLPGLDLRIGKQRIAWGTADKINPTDNLNPKDFEDPLDFGRKLPVNALRLTAYVGNWAVDAAYVPVFTPAVLPPADWRLGPDLMPGVGRDGTYSKLQTVLHAPASTLRDGANLGLRITTSVWGYDVSASYAYTRDDLPVPAMTRIEIQPQGPPQVTTTLVYPRQHVVGMDVAGEISEVGLWAEAAAFLPEREVRMRTWLSAGSAPPRLISEELVLPREVYVKYVVGADYTWPGGIYWNAQFIHGFYGERGRKDLENYLLVAVERKFRHEVLKIRLAGLLGTPQVRRARSCHTRIVLPEISLYPSDGVELVLGGYWIAARGPTTLSGFAGNDELFLKVRVSF